MARAPGRLRQGRAGAAGGRRADDARRLSVGDPRARGDPGEIRPPLPAGRPAPDLHAGLRPAGARGRHHRPRGSAAAGPAGDHDQHGPPESRRPPGVLGAVRRRRRRPAGRRAGDGAGMVGRPGPRRRTGVGRGGPLPRRPPTPPTPPRGTPPAPG
jgi:hypothetical protein